jgi:predicted ATPase with chaperone activity
MLDRIHLIVSVPRVPSGTLLTTNMQTNKQRVAVKNITTITTEKQCNRYNSSMKNNNNLTNRDIKSKLALTPEVRQFLSTATDKLNLSARSDLKTIPLPTPLPI